MNYNTKKVAVHDKEIVKSARFISSGDNWCSDDGIEVVTNHAIYKATIKTGQNCCENYGYFFSEDDLDRFTGATLLNVEITDEKLETTVMPPDVNVDIDACIFFTFYTSLGPLQFVVYNEHNGYYGHRVLATKVSLDGSNKQEMLDVLL